MNPNAFLKGLYTLSFLVFLTAQGAALIIWRNLEIHLGLLAGYLLGIVPFLSWHLIVTMTDGFKRRDRILWAAAVGVGKYGLLGLGLFALVKSDLLLPPALLAGMLVMLPALLWSAIFRSAPRGE